MEGKSVKIRELLFNNFKNVNSGKIVFVKNQDKEESNNILGLYGGNGTGKTTVFNVLEIVKYYLSDRPYIVPSQIKEDWLRKFKDYLTINEDSSSISLKFDIKISKKDYLVEYNLQLVHNKDNSFQFNIFQEKLSYKEKNSKATYAIKYKANLGYSFTENLKIRMKPLMPFLNVLGGMYNGIYDKSSIFNNDLLKEVKKHKLNEEVLFQIILELRYFVTRNMCIITNESFGRIDSLVSLPLTFRYSDPIKKNVGPGIDLKVEAGGVHDINLREPHRLDNNTYTLLEKIMQNINSVLDKIIPNMSVSIMKQDTMLDNGVTGKLIELYTERSGKRIPMRNESSGIVKIISIVQTLIYYCQHEHIFLAIDEFDSSIYEYLFGSLIEALSEEGKGQLIFSSHNLRALEVLDKKNIYFSTTNPNNRYIQLQHVKTNHNLRDFYYRTIILGGQTEKIYNNNDISGLKIALRGNCDARD